MTQNRGQSSPKDITSIKTLVDLVVSVTDVRVLVSRGTRLNVSGPFCPTFSPPLQSPVTQLPLLRQTCPLVDSVQNVIKRRLTSDRKYCGDNYDLTHKITLRTVQSFYTFVYFVVNVFIVSSGPRRVCPFHLSSLSKVETIF